MSHNSNSTGAEGREVDQEQLSRIKRCSRLLSVFAAMDSNGKGRIEPHKLSEAFRSVLGIAVPDQDGPKVAEYIMAKSGDGKALTRLGFVRAFCDHDPTAKWYESGERKLPVTPAAQKVACIVLDGNMLVDMSQSCSMRGGETMAVAAAELIEMLYDVLEGWTADDIAWVLSGRKGRLPTVVMFEAALGHFDAALTRGGGLTPQTAGTDVLKAFTNVLQARKMTIADAYRAIDVDTDGLVTAAEVCWFLGGEEHAGSIKGPSILCVRQSARAFSCAQCGVGIAALFGRETTMDYNEFRSI